GHPLHRRHPDGRRGGRVQLPARGRLAVHLLADLAARRERHHHRRPAHGGAEVHPALRRGDQRLPGHQRQLDRLAHGPAADGGGAVRGDAGRRGPVQGRVQPAQLAARAGAQPGLLQGWPALPRPAHLPVDRRRPARLPGPAGRPGAGLRGAHHHAAAGAGAGGGPDHRHRAAADVAVRGAAEHAAGPVRRPAGAGGDLPRHRLRGHRAGPVPRPLPGEPELHRPRRPVPPRDGPRLPRARPRARPAARRRARRALGPPRHAQELRGRAGDDGAADPVAGGRHRRADRKLRAVHAHPGVQLRRVAVDAADRGRVGPRRGRGRRLPVLVGLAVHRRQGPRARPAPRHRRGHPRPGGARAALRRGEPVHQRPRVRAVRARVRPRQARRGGGVRAGPHHEDPADRGQHRRPLGRGLEGPAVTDAATGVVARPRWTAPPSLRLAGRRLLMVVPIILGVSILTFWVLDLIPGNAAEQLLGPGGPPGQGRALGLGLGLDRPAVLRYLDWLGGAVTGDLGTSLVNGQPVTDQIVDRMAVTGELVALAFLVSLGLAVPVALLAAYRPGRLFDRVSMVVSITGLSVANYVLALLLVLVFAVELALFPAIGFVPLSESVA